MRGRLSIPRVALLLVAVVLGAGTARSETGQELSREPHRESLPALLAGTTRIETEWGPIHAAAGAEEFAGRIADLLPAAVDRCRTALGDDRPLRATFVVCDGSLEMATVMGNGVPTWAAAVANARIRLVALSAPSLRPWPEGKVRSTLTHEVCHLFLGRLGSDPSHPVRLPRWLEEGVAQWVAEDVYLGEADQLVRAVLVDDLLSFLELEDTFPEGSLHAQLAYLQSESFVRYLADRYGSGIVVDLIRTYAERPDIFATVHDLLDTTWSDLESGWRSWIRAEHSFLGTFLRRLPWLSVGAILLVLAFWRRRRKDRRIQDGWPIEITADGEETGPSPIDMR